MNSSNPQGQQQAPITDLLSSDMTTVVKQDNIYAEQFIPVPGSNVIAFIERGYDGTPQILNLWQPASNSLVKLNHKKSPDDFSVLDSFCLSNDGRYLIASVTPTHKPQPGCRGIVIPDTFAEVLIWDLQNQTLEPSQRITTKVPAAYTCRSCVITESNTLMMHYRTYDQYKGGFYSYFTTFRIADNGTLQPLNQLFEKVFFAVLMPKDLIVMMQESTSNTFHVYDSNGNFLHTHFLKSDQGKLEKTKDHLDVINREYLTQVALIDKNTLAFTHYNCSIYIVDISQPDQFKQIAYVDSALLNIKWGDNVYPLPMQMETGLVALHTKTMLYFFDIKQNKVLSRCQLNFQNDSDLSEFQGSLENGYLISSVYAKKGEEPIRSISIRMINLFSALAANETLYNDIFLPRDIAALIGSYLHSDFRCLRSPSLENPSSCSIFNNKKRKCETSSLDKFFTPKKIKTDDAMTDDRSEKNDSQECKTENRDGCRVM